MLFRVALCAAAILLVGGCGGDIQINSSSSAVHVSKGLAPPDSTVVPIDTTPYHVAPGDELTVSVYGAPDLATTGVVDSAGNFAMPLAGTMHVVGLTPQQISSALEDKLRGSYVKHPRVSLNVKPTGNQQSVTVDGDVQQPGIYPVVGRMTLQQAIATAHGATQAANIRKVVVFRTVNNQKMAAMFDMKAIRSGQTPDPEIFGNDIVVVGESRVLKFLQNGYLAFTMLGRFLPVP